MTLAQRMKLGAQKLVPGKTWNFKGGATKSVAKPIMMKNSQNKDYYSPKQKIVSKNVSKSK